MKGKKILILSSGDNHGAYEAAYRIAKFAKEEGYQVALVVKNKTKYDSFIIEVKTNSGIQQNQYIKRVISKLKKVLLKKRNHPPKTDPKYLFLEEDETTLFFPTAEILKLVQFKPDLIIVGMVNGFITTQNLVELFYATSAKIAMVTTDMSHLTGGCHYSWGCDGYTNDCSNCPAIINKEDLWWPKKNLAIKKINAKKAKIEVMSMSGFSSLQINKSAIFRNQEIHLINSCIDLNVFNRNSRAFAKDFFNIKPLAKVIFIGSQQLTDERKGVSFVIDALHIVASRINPMIKENIIVILVGKDIDSVGEIRKQIPFKIQFLEYIKDYRLLSLLYQASDVFICGSIEDTGPMMVSESLACGTPVVGFDTGIIYNIVDNNKNGVKVPVKDTIAMSKGIQTILESDKIEFEKMSIYGFNKILKESSKQNVLDAINKILI